MPSRTGRISRGHFSFSLQGGWEPVAEGRSYFSRTLFPPFCRAWQTPCDRAKRRQVSHVSHLNGTPISNKYQHIIAKCPICPILLGGGTVGQFENVGHQMGHQRDSHH